MFPLPAINPRVRQSSADAATAKSFVLVSRSLSDLRTSILASSPWTSLLEDVAAPGAIELCELLGLVYPYHDCR